MQKTYNEVRTYMLLSAGDEKPMRLCDIRDKEVINLCNCKKLGYVMDLDVDLCSGCVEALVVPITAGVCGFLGCEMVYVIPLGCINKIGEDMILVEICEEKCKRKET